MTLDQQIAVLQALKDGKTLEYRGHSHAAWLTLKITSDPPRLNFGHHDFRVKQEPRVIYVNEYKGGLGFHHYLTPGQAEAHAVHDATRQIKFTEVVEDDK